MPIGINNSVILKTSVDSSFVQVKCQQIKKSDRDAADGLATLPASKTTVLHAIHYLENRRDKGDYETRAAATKKQTSNKTGYNWGQTERLAQYWNAWRNHVGGPCTRRRGDFD